MKCRLITVASDLNVEGLPKLIASAEKYDWPLEVINTEWKGFGTKLLSVRNYLIINPEVTHFFFCDAYDCVALLSMDMALEKIKLNWGFDKIVCSAERGCWPDGDLEKQYTNRFEHRFNYLNSGLYFAPRDKFLSLFEVNMPNYETDDQLWFTHMFLLGDLDIVLDNNCEVFQSYSFIEDGDYDCIGGNLANLRTHTFPALAHGNGRSDMTKLYELI